MSSTNTIGSSSQYIHTPVSLSINSLGLSKSILPDAQLQQFPQRRYLHGRDDHRLEIEAYTSRAHRTHSTRHSRRNRKHRAGSGHKSGETARRLHNHPQRSGPPRPYDYLERRRPIDLPEVVKTQGNRYLQMDSPECSKYEYQRHDFDTLHDLSPTTDHGPLDHHVHLTEPKYTNCRDIDPRTFSISPEYRWNSHIAALDNWFHSKLHSLTLQLQDISARRGQLY